MPWFDFFRRKHPQSGATTAARPTGERKYIENVPYLLPKDLGETNRLDFQHYMLRYALKGNYAAPVENPHDILDVGTGTGRWAMEMAQQFPAANVIGVDVASPPVDAGSAPDTRPDNYAFVQGNVLDRLPFADNSFDFVHQRFLVLAIPLARWPGVVAELMRVTRPGGWIELIETQPPMGAPAIDQLATWGMGLMRHRGIDFHATEQLGSMLQAAGAMQVSSRVTTIQVGRPNGRIGSMAAVDYLTAVAAIRGPLGAMKIVEAPAFDDMMARGRQEFDTAVYPQPVFIAFGRKPA